MPKSKGNGSQPRVGVASATTTSVAKSQPGQGMSKGARRRRRDREQGKGGGNVQFRGRVSAGGPRAYGSNVGNPSGGVLQHVVSAPAVEGFVMPTSSFSMKGNAQTLSDYDPGHSVRVSGNGLFSVAVATVITQAGILAGALYAFLTPSVMDARLSKIESVFQFYAIRWCKLTFITSLPSSSTTAALAFGIASDAGLTGFTTPTQVLELTPSMLTPSWQCASMVYTHVGTKVWECFASSAPALDTIQALVYGSNNTATASLTQTIGSLYVEYVVDFYEPGPVLSSVNLDQLLLKQKFEAEVRKRREDRERSSTTSVPMRLSCEATGAVVSPPEGTKTQLTSDVNYVIVPGSSVAQSDVSAASQGSSGTWFLRR